MNISNKDKFIMMNILNQSTSNLPKHPRRLSVFPERFPLYGDVSCYIELDNANEIEDTWDNYNMMDFLHYTSFAASLFTSTHKKNITLTIQDFCTINCKNVFLLKGIIPSNAIEENCHLFVFKNSIYHVNHESINYNESTSTQANTNKSVLIGYCDIKYYKDRYITLSEFLIHSVYDTKSLANEIGKHFSPYEYLRDFPHAPLDHDIVDNSPFRNFYLNFFNNQTTCRNTLTLDENLVKSFRHIEIPKDWSLLGQNSASNKKLLRENLLHFSARHNLKKFCSTIINLPGSFEGLECLNLDGELPCQLAIKKKHKKIAILMFDFYSKNEKLSSKMSLTSSPRTKSKLAQKYSAISSLMSMPPLPHNLHHNPHHHHQNHHQSNLSIFDIKHFSSNLSTADPNETMDSPTETIKQSIFTDRPISTEDVIIVDDDDQIVLPIKNLSREIKLKHKSSNESLYSKIKSPDASDNLAAKTNSAKPPQLGILKKHRNTSTSSMPEESKRVMEKHVHKLTSDSHKSESMRVKLDTSDPTSYKPRSLLRNKTRTIRKAAENKEEIYCQINDDYEELNENSIYEDIDSDGSELDNTTDEGEHLDTNNDVESDVSIDLSCFDTAKDNKKIDDTEPNESKIMCSVKQAPKPKNKIAKLFNTFSNSLQQESALLPPLPRHSILPQSITVAPLTNSQNDFDRNLNTRRSKRFTKPSNLAIQEISISSNNSPSNSSSCSPVSTSGSAAINLQKAASTPSIFDKIKNDNKAKHDDSNDKIGLSSQSTFSSSSLNTVDSNKNNKNEVKNQKLNKRCEHNLKLSQHKTESAPSTQLPLFQTENCANSNECHFLSSSASKHLSPVDTGSPSSKKELVTVNEFLKEFEMAQKNNEISQVEEPAYLIPLGASTATNSKSSLVSQVTAEPATVFTSPVNRSPNSATSYDQLILQQSTPLKNQLDSHAKALSKSKKLGNILKLASVRGAKSKSMKHKYSSQIHQHAFVNKTVTSETTCDTCQKSLLNKKALICKNCQIMIHDSPCKDQVIQCLFYKKSIFSQSKSNSSSSTSAFNINRVKITNDDKTKLDETDDRDNLIASGYSSGGIIVGLNGLNPSNSIKTIHVTNNRPKSMDISKYFQNTKKAHLSKSTSNMYSKSINEECADYEAIKSLRESTDSLNYKLESEANLNPTNSSSSMINSVLNQNTVSSNGSSSSSASIFSGTGLNSNFNFYMNELNAEFYNFELEFSANNWADLQDKDYLQSLSRQLRNKQENIFEFIKTEVNYYKILCMCQRMFKNILINDCRIESKTLEQIFPDLERLMDLHKVLLDQLIDRYRSSKNKYIDYIGDILSNILSEKNEMWVSLYSKVCCSHVTAKQTFKQLSTSNKAVASFSIEISKHSWLKRYHIPDCLTIITQRLTKYLTLIENILTNSQDDKIEIDLLNKSLENLRSILSRVNDAVAFYQNYNEFKKYLDNFDQKSQTKSFVKYEKNIEERAFTKSDLTSKPNRKIISLNQVTVKVMSMKGKEYKNVTCVTMNDMIVFLQYNEKSSKYTFMNDTKSVIICNYGILIRPKQTDINHLQSQSSQIHHQRTVSQSNSIKLNQANANSGQNASTKSFSHESLITYIAHTITNEIFEVKFPDEISRNQWLILVHTHITPFIEVNKENVEDKVTTSEPPQDELTISSDIAALICTFNNLLSNHMTVNLMRSASSAGETITKTSQDNQISIPKRAETFNGASSSKESQMSIININSELFQKSKVFQTYSPKNCDTLSTTTNTESDYSTTTNKSADSGYQSKSCCIYADLDQSISACICSDKADAKNAFFEENTLQSMPRNSFEQMLRTILNDYTKTKKENFELKKSIENKDKSIDLLKKALDEYKVQLDNEKQDLEQKFIDLEKKENLDATSGTANITRLSHNISQSSNNIQINNSINSTQSNQCNVLADTNLNNNNNNAINSQSMSNKVSIMVKCERSLLSSNAQVKKEDDKNGSDSSILFL